MSKQVTNEEKAKDILNCQHCLLGEKICFTPTETPCVNYRDIVKMAQWKDEQCAQEKQQWIDKAWDWLTNQKGEHTKEDFIKAMNGE